VTAFFKEFTTYHPKPLDPGDPSPSEIAAKIHAFSAQERTTFYINGLRGLKLLHLLSIDTPEHTEKSRIEAFLAHREILEVSHLKVDHLSYPPYLNGGSSRHIDTNQIAYALSAVAKGKMEVSEDLATELLHHLPDPQTRKPLFAKGLAKHLVAPYGASPSAEYRQAFDAARAYLNDNHHGFGRQSQWADFKHYLRQLMNKAVRKNA